MSIMDKLKDPELLASLGLGERLSGSLIVMVLGLACCVLILLLIMVVVKLLKIASTGREAAVEAGPAASVAAPGPEEDEAALAAAIMAAIAEQEGEGRFYIRNITAAPEREAWARAGLEDAADGRGS